MSKLKWGLASLVVVVGGVAGANFYADHQLKQYYQTPSINKNMLKVKYDHVQMAQKVKEEYEGHLGTVGHRTDSAMAKGGLTARPTSRAGAKAGHSDPVVLYGRAIAQRIKGTLGITG